MQEKPQNAKYEWGKVSSAVIGGVVIVLMFTGLIGYGVFREVAGTSSLHPVASAKRTPPPGFKTYANEHYEFSFFYPETSAVREVDEGTGALTIVVENKDASTGFQIFIVPYSSRTISQERFLMDTPSGIRKNEKKISVGEVEAVAFDSSDVSVGDTKEVWFISKGYLFEASTLAELEAGMMDALTTWEFF